VSTFPVALDDLKSGVKGLGVVDAIITSVQGRFFFAGNGYATYINRDTLSLQIPSYIFAANEASIRVPSDLEDVFNRIRMNLHPKTYSATPIVLGKHDGAMALLAGEEREFFVSYKHPTIQDMPIGGVNFITPVSGTDWHFTANADGTGANLTGSVTLAVSFFTTSAKFVVKNVGGVTAHKQILQGRGTGIYDLSKYFVESYTARDYGNRPTEIDLPYSDNALEAAEQVSFLNATYRDLGQQISEIIFHPQRSDALMAQACGLEISQIVGGSDPISLPGGAQAVVQNIQWTINEDKVMSCRLVTAPWIVIPTTESDTVEVDDDLVNVQAAPETRIDFALIDFSEIA
jgi:hypothetical protein